MADHVPVGYLTLVEAFQRFYQTKWGGHDPLAELADSRFTDHLNNEDAARHHIAKNKVIGIDRRRFLWALEFDGLEAVYSPSALGGLHRIPPVFWSETFFPERLFLSGGEEVAQHVDARWNHLVGHTPVVDRGALDGWMAGYMAAQIQDERPAKPRRLLAGILLDLISDDVLTSEEAGRFTKDWLLPDLGACVPLRQFSWEELEAETELPVGPLTINQIPEADPSQPPKRKSGRPRGSTKWPEKELFIAEMERRLGELGEPSGVKAGWESWEIARSLVMEWFINELPEPREPSASTAKGWEREARDRWEAVEKSKKSENPVA